MNNRAQHMIVDFRLRPPFKGFLSTLMWNVERTQKVNVRLGYTPTDSISNRSMQALFKEMDDAGISMGVAAGRDQSSVIGGVGNDDLIDLHSTYPDRFVTCASVDPTDSKAAIGVIENYVLDKGCKGVVVEPGIAPNPMYPSDTAIFPIYERCQELRVPVLVMGGGNAGPDISYSDPLHIDRVAKAFPELKIVATHGGWPFVQQIVGVAFRRPNVFVCPDMYLLNAPGCQDYVAAANSYMQDQFLFGTSYPFTPVKQYVEEFLKLPFRAQVLDKLLCSNAQRVLGL